MIELPFKMIFDLNFSNGIANKILLNKLKDLFSNITPTPLINLSFYEIDKNLYDFIINIKKYFEIDITALNPKINDIFLNLIKEQIINIEIDNEEYDLSKLEKYNYNLKLPIKNNLYEYLNKINKKNINKIIIKHCKTNLSYEDFKKQIDLIINEDFIKQKCYLLPYLEEKELKKYYSNNGEIRPFLTCSSLWFNPIINHQGKISLPCYHSQNSLNEADFFDLWDCDDLNNVRQNLINLKQFEKCKYCEKFYKDNFFIVEDGILKYKGEKFFFENVLNPIKSAPMLGIILKEDCYFAIPFYSDEEIIKSQKELKMIIKI